MGTNPLENEMQLAMETLNNEFIEAEASKVFSQLQEAESARKTLTDMLSPYIDRFFAARVAKETDRELRRDNADLMKAKELHFLDEKTLRFTAKNWSGAISADVTIKELLAS